jgi:gamma-glutamylputrescine oxidase
VKLGPPWQDTEPPPAVALDGTLHVDVAVVGGGLTGLSAAYHLAATRPGIRVAVLEATHAGAGASGRNTGMLGPGVGQSLGALVRRLGAIRAAALYRETLAAVSATRTLIEREHIACDLHMTGQILRARSRSDRQRLGRQAAQMKALDLPVEILDDAAAARALRLAPAAGDAGDGPAALRLPHAGLLDPGKLVAGLAAAAQARGVQLFGNARVQTIAGGEPGKPARLSITGGAQVIADRVVVATAGYTPALGLLRGRVLPVHLQALATAPLPAAVRAALGWSGREGVVEARRIFNYFRLTEEGRLVFGGGAPCYHWGARPAATAAATALATLRRELASTFPEHSGVAQVPVTHLWTGLIGYTLDALPSIGRQPGRPGIVHAVGWCGHGLALAVASGAWLGRLLFDDRALLARTGAVDLERLAWFRSSPPALPGEALRWLSFRSAVGAMALLDRAR